jgi:nitrogen regulatory protein PII
MKTLIVIIRNECVESLRSELETMGIRELAVLDVMCQKQQAGGTGKSPLNSTWRTTNRNRPGQWRVVPSVPDNNRREDSGMTRMSPAFFPRSMLIMAVADATVIPVIRALAETSRAGCRNDGGIFVCPMVTSMGIRDNKTIIPS